ncbi:transcriptional regulator [Sphingomonas hylomeconis]|uniref:Helix-turn-helix domain-containing protein n=1 Tax=Sphingomonas hylomeconis TaxID=1395958 RepID=A0ABV7SYF4_9SPHN|nr:helix-turn-helix domain-containing protein [Sphingomonas hylomeconis]
MTTRYDISDTAYEAAYAAFKQAVALAPGQIAFANICRCTQGNISQLLRAGSLLPERFVIKVEAATGVPRHELRPDIYPIEQPHLPVPNDDRSVISPRAVTVACDRQPISQPGAAR